MYTKHERHTYYSLHKDEISAYQKKYRKDHPGKVKATQLQSYQKMGFESFAAYQKHLRDTYREKAIEALGCKCAHCGMTDIRILEIDHKNGDGNLDRKKSRNSIAYYKAIIEDAGQRFQLLCPNCHALKTFEKKENTRR